jgi:carboxymethylenebutenolidase
MPRKEAGNFDQALLDLYDRYAHNLINRREFLEKAGKYAAGGVGQAGVKRAMISQEISVLQQW